MEYNEFIEIFDQLFEVGGRGTLDDRQVKIESIEDDSVSINYFDMYRNPVENTFNFGLKLVDLFGTQAIDFDNNSISGCDTCDWGSEYGTVYNIKKITKNMDNMRKLARERYSVNS